MAINYRLADGINEQPVSQATPLPVFLNPVEATSGVSSAVPSAAGTGYVPADTITIAGGDYTTPAVLTVTDTKVITATVVAGGTGGTPGAVTITGTTGTGTKFQATGTITAGGILSGALTVSVAGDYTVNPTDITAEPVTGGSLSGCTVALTMGVLTVSVTTAGNYTTLPTSPASQLSTSGSGTGATFTLTTASFTGSGTSARVSVTRTADTNAYTANDVLGSATGSTAALTFPLMGPSGGRIMITSTTLEIDASSIPAGMTSFRLHLYNVTPPSAYGDNVAWDIASGDRASYLGFIELGTPNDLGSTLYIQTDGINKQLKLAGTSLFGYLVTSGGYTPASGTVHVVTVQAVAV
ncbi:MAG: hypothetical protein EPO02_13780 [Nitrospirae bacterium]|nr:MAG: hypothetical protein EPO02_13780 [Nitrospirota bacterium]